MKQKWTVKKMALIALMGALSAILMLLRFPMPFMPPFIDFDLATLPEIIGGFTMGPFAAVMIILIKILIKLVTQGTTTMFTGELQNIILSCAYVIPAILIYNHDKSKRTAVQGMAAGTIICSLTAVFTNLFIIIPFYVNLMGFTMDRIISMCAAVSPLMKDTFTLAIFGIIPANFIKYSVASLVTYVLYKRVSGSIKSFIK